MKKFSVLSNQYIKGTKTINNATLEVKDLLEKQTDKVDDLLDMLFEDEDLSIESPEYFEFRSHPVIKTLLHEDFSGELSAIVSNLKTEDKPVLTKAVKCAHCAGEFDKPAEDNWSEYDRVNNLFGSDSELDDELCLTKGSVDMPLFCDKVKKMNDVQEEARKEINEAMKNIGKYDRDVLKENLDKLVLVKTFINEYNK